MTAPDAQSPAEDRAFGKALRFQFGLGVDLFIDARHRDENGRPHFLQRLRQILDEWTVSECYAVVEHREIHMARGNVAQRQERNTDQSWSHVESQQGTLDVRGDVAVGEHRAFGSAGGA